ncbi:hypothetical protein [Arthrobacter sp. YAF16]|uniref:hypothetical protein n=1 Tax=Arthrobacter sp. YAF16 TaxID=3233076 RepID=UPI003F8E1A3B
MRRAVTESYRVFPNTYLIGDKAGDAASGRVVVGAHGTGVLRGRLITSTRLASEVVERNPRASLNELGQDLRGSLTLYILEPAARRLSVLPDPLGGGLVFVWKGDEGHAVSSDLAALVSFLDLIGAGPKKSLEYVAAYVATGSGGLVESSYEDIVTVPQFSYIEISPAGVVVREYPQKGEFFESTMSYDDSLEVAQGEIESNVSALRESEHSRKIAHLTGGVDSRVVLAAVLAGGQQSEFAFYCSGGPTEPDKMVAESLAVEFGLTMTNHNGLDIRTSPVTLEDQLLWPFQLTSGIISGVAHPGNAPTETAIASGGYGELFRSFYDKGDPHFGTVRDAAERMFGRLAFGGDARRRLTSEKFLLRAQRQLADVLESAAASGVRPDARLDFVYMNRRNRYYVGEISRSVSAVAARFDPLYSPAGASLGLRIDGKMRHANVIGMDLIERMSPGLSLLPFDTDRFAGAYSDLRGVPGRKPFKSSERPIYDDAKKMQPDNASSLSSVRPSPADIERAVALRMSPRLVTQFPSIRDGLKEIITGLPRGEFDSVFNRRAVSLLIDREPTHRAYYRTARDLYAALLWYARG